MRALALVAAASILASTLSAPIVLAQQTDPAIAAPDSADQIKQELEKIKKGRTLAIIPAVGIDDAEGTTLLRLGNTSAFNIVVLVVGPTTARVELGPEGMQTLSIEPGDYEIAMTVVGRDVPPFYGKQTIVGNMLFRHQFVIPAV